MGEISNRDELEAMFGSKVLRLTREQRNRLVALLGNPPNVANVPESFWIEAGRSLYTEIAVLLATIGRQSAQEHGATEFQAQLFVNQYAEPRAREMVSGWIDHSKEILQAASQQWQDTTKPSGEPAPPTRSDAIEVSDTIFGPDRVGRMASTETTSAQTAGAEAAVSLAGGASPNDLWFTREDGKVCTVCRPLHETPRSFWSQYVPAGPPAHPDCRCYLLYENLDEVRQTPAETQ
ncbi:MAG: hypothetical protein JSS49_05425 [Planctomycetes bacterium]|nr:hypothetical protein [Planctomycetota bacterium]